MALSMHQVPAALGQTSAGSSQADLLAMNAPDSELPRLCQQGNALACQLARIPQSTQAELDARARERDRQAQAEREHTARKLAQVGVNPRIVQAARDGRDVRYVAALPYVPPEPGAPPPRYDTSGYVPPPAFIQGMPGWVPYVLGGLAAVGAWMLFTEFRSRKPKAKDRGEILV